MNALQSIFCQMVLQLAEFELFQGCGLLILLQVLELACYNI